MTALARYARLETVGRWRAGPGEPARAVGVRFGDATLVLTDDDGHPLGHWSLPAVARLNPGEAPARYAPDADGGEWVEIDDDLMIDAIESVRRVVHRARPRAARGGRWAALGAALAAVAALAAWGPGALRREALGALPAAKRAEIGATLLGHLQRRLGTACASPLGTAALDRLGARAGEGGGVVVLPLGPDHPLLLPGGIVVLGRDLVERAAEPAVLAGQVVAARAGGDPMAPLLHAAGTLATLGLLATGELPPDALAARAAALVDLPAPAPDPEALRAAFAAADVPIGPWLADRDPSGARPPDDPAAEAPPILSDADWVALQGICG